MRFSVGSHQVRLPRDGLLAIEAPADLRIEAHGGHAWVTRDGVAEDVVLAPGGGEWRMPASGRLLVQALTPLRLQVRRLPAPRASWRTTLGGWWQALVRPRANAAPGAA